MVQAHWCTGVKAEERPEWHTIIEVGAGAHADLVCRGMKDGLLAQGHSKRNTHGKNARNGFSLMLTGAFLMALDVA